MIIKRCNRIKRKSHVRLIFPVLLLPLVLWLLHAWRLSGQLTIADCELQAPIPAPVRLVQLTDLHNDSFGSGNEQLIGRIRELQPDLILMTGDIVDRDCEDTEIVTALIRELDGIAPVYYSYGNHEVDWESRYGCRLRERLTAAGAIVLDNEFVDMEVKGAALRLGGYMGYYGQPHMHTKDALRQREERAFYKALPSEERYVILLNHIPTSWVDWGYVNRPLGIDLVLSGHYHGGLVRLPLLNRGLYAPYIGLLPPHTGGVYIGTEASCILSTGLSGAYGLPRLGNPPELVVVELVPAASAATD